MHTFKDPNGAARAAVIAVSFYAVFDLLTAIVNFFMPRDPAEFGPAKVANLLESAALLASMIFVGRWIYRTNANAHTFSDDVSITPGWAVGWFFVPLANLIKPYEGVKETWIASQQAAGHYEEVESPLVLWWWGLWIGTNIVSGVSAQILAMNPQPNPALAVFEILVAIANIALCLVLIQLMQRLSRAQVAANQSHVFA